jgi:acetyl esterase/lipase
MDIYLPGGGGRPAVMMIHGGGWNSGDKDAYTARAKLLAGAGYVTATINYRLVPEGRYPRAVQDAACALSFLRAHAGEYGLDPDRVALMGYSAGAHLASLIGVAADLPEHVPDCAVGGSGPPQAVIAGAGPQELRTSVGEDFLGGSKEEIPDVYDKASPVLHVGPGEPPFLLIHGGGDWLVPVEDSVRMRDALIEAGNHAELAQIEGGGHLLSPGPSPGDVQGEVADFVPEAWLISTDFLRRALGDP